MFPDFLEELVGGVKVIVQGFNGNPLLLGQFINVRLGRSILSCEPVPVGDGVDQWVVSED